MSVWKSVLKSEQEWILPAQLGQLQRRQCGKGLLQSHLWSQTELAMVWNRIKRIVRFNSQTQYFNRSRLVVIKYL